jgi:hypothetical protein
MNSSVLSRSAGLAAVVTLSLAVLAGPLVAQTTAQQPAPPRGSAPGTGPSPAERPAIEKEKSVEGPVKNVDPAAQTLRVSSGLFGLMGRTLEVTDQTQIQVEGRQGTLADIREGAKVRASYESRDGRNVATRIDVMPASASEMPSSRSGSSGNIGSSPGGTGSSSGGMGTGSGTGTRR